MTRLKPEQLLAATHFDTDERHPHIVIDPVACRTYPSDRACELNCPAARYAWDDANDVMHFDHVGCVECGNCRLVCQRLHDGAPGYSWSYPSEGMGVTYQQG